MISRKADGDVKGADGRLSKNKKARFSERAFYIICGYLFVSLNFNLGIANADFHFRFIR